MNDYKLIIYTNKPINGFWNGGNKNKFEWYLGHTNRDLKGEYQKINGFDANYWFYVSKGKTNKQTLSYALKHLKNNLKKNGLTISFFEIIKT